MSFKLITRPAKKHLCVGREKAIREPKTLKNRETPLRRQRKVVVYSDKWFFSRKHLCVGREKRPFALRAVRP